MAKDREGAASEVGAKLTVENYEEAVVLMTKPPAPGAALFLTRFSMDPAKIDENLEFFKTTVAPEISDFAKVQKSVTGYETTRGALHLGSTPWT